MKLHSSDKGFNDYEQQMTCVGCGLVMDAHLATAQDSGPPTENTTAICADCGQMQIYVIVDGQFAFRHLTDEEFAAHMRDPHVRRLIGATRAARERNQPYRR